jgi:hypothetical protein
VRDENRELTRPDRGGRFEVTNSQPRTAIVRDVFGDQTVSSRLVFGVASLPLGSPVELEVILELNTD